MTSLLIISSVRTLFVVGQTDRDGNNIIFRSPPLQSGGESHTARRGGVVVTHTLVVVI